MRIAVADHPCIDIRETTEMGLALLDFITGYRGVGIVDSIQTGKAAFGFLHELDAAELNQLTGRTPHFVGVSETLALGRQLGLAMPAPTADPAPTFHSRPRSAGFGRSVDSTQPHPAHGETQRPPYLSGWSPRYPPLDNR